MMNHRARLLIAYNADTGLLTAAWHTLHKLVSPSTYPCSLCALTHGALMMHGRWKRFLGSLPLDVLYYHRDDFAEAYPGYSCEFPAILLAENGLSPRVLVSAQELDRMDDLSDLIGTLEARLMQERPRQPMLRAVG